MLNNGKGLPAKIIATAPKSDLAVIQLDVVPDDAKPLRLAKAPVKAGQRVLVVCAPFSTKEMWTYSPGIIAGVAPRRWKEESLGLPGTPGHDFDCRVMQTEHFLDRAQMGGPVVNERGEVVAMNQGVGDGGRTGCMSRRSAGEMPIRCSKFDRVCAENTVCRRSPVPASPTTTPYPINWLSRTPSTLVSSLIRVAVDRGGGGEIAKSNNGRMQKEVIRFKRSAKRFQLKAKSSKLTARKVISPSKFCTAHSAAESNLRRRLFH
jgi:hypothetical protein